MMRPIQPGKILDDHQCLGLNILRNGDNKKLQSLSFFRKTLMTLMQPLFPYMLYFFVDKVAKIQVGQSIADL